MLVNITIWFIGWSTTSLLSNRKIIVRLMLLVEASLEKSAQSAQVLEVVECSYRISRNGISLYSRALNPEPGLGWGERSLALLKTCRC